MTDHLFIHASGTPEDRGRRYGALARDRILRNLAFYADMFEKGWGVPWARSRRWRSPSSPTSKPTSPRDSGKCARSPRGRALRSGTF